MKYIQTLLFSLLLSSSVFGQEWNSTGNNTTTGNLSIGSTATNSYSKLTIKGPNSPTGIASKRDLSFEFAAAGKSQISAYRGLSWNTYMQFLTTPPSGGSPKVRLHLNDDGNVGIGTTNPDERLHVEGNLLLDSYSLGNDKGIFFREGFTTSNSYNLSILNYDHSNGGVSPDGLSINAYDGVSFSTGSSTRNERMRISKNGYIGIGTTTPQEKLHVKNGTASIEGDIGVPTGSYWSPGRHTFELQNNDKGDVVMSFHRAAASNAAIVHSSLGGFTFKATGSPSDEHMHIAKDGNVGIGTTSPNTKLVVNDDTVRGFKDHIKLTSNSETYGLAFAGQGHHRGGIYAENFGGTSSGQGNITVWARNEGNIILDGGNVGIGTKTPSGKFNIINSATIGGNNLANASILLGNTGSGMGIDTNEILTKGLDLYLGTLTPDKNVYLRAGGTSERMTINGTTGNIGIGTTDPKNKLSVNGTIWAKKVIVKLTDGADWVFEDDYKLRPLSEVENFIQKNKHLPEIPSADEFRANDMEVSEMTNKLLQKIEELTLYTIAQEKEINAIKSTKDADLQLVKDENKALAHRLAKLEALLLK